MSPFAEGSAGLQHFQGIGSSLYLFALHKKKAIKSRKFICLELFCTFSFLACTENSFQLECCDVEHAFASMYSFPSSPDFLLCDGIIFLVPVQQVAGGKIPFYFCVWMPEVSLKGSLEIILIEERLASHSVFWSRNRENSAFFCISLKAYKRRISRQCL